MTPPGCQHEKPLPVAGEGVVPSARHGSSGFAALSVAAAASGGCCSGGAARASVLALRPSDAAIAVMRRCAWAAAWASMSGVAVVASALFVCNAPVSVAPLVAGAVVVWLSAPLGTLSAVAAAVLFTPVAPASAAALLADVVTVRLFAPLGVRSVVAVSAALVTPVVPAFTAVPLTGSVTVCPSVPLWLFSAGAVVAGATSPALSVAVVAVGRPSVSSVRSRISAAL